MSEITDILEENTHMRSETHHTHRVVSIVFFSYVIYCNISLHISGNLARLW